MLSQRQTAKTKNKTSSLKSEYYHVKTVWSVDWTEEYCQQLAEVTTLSSILRQSTCECVYLRSYDKDDSHNIQSAIAKNPMIHTNFTAPSYIELELLLIELLHCRNRDFCLFCSCELDLDLMTLHMWILPVFPQDVAADQKWTFWVKLLKVIVLHIYIHCEAKKTAPFYFCNSFVRTSSFMTMFGTHIHQ